MYPIPVSTKYTVASALKAEPMIQQSHDSIGLKIWDSLSVSENPSVAAETDRILPMNANSLLLMSPRTMAIVGIADSDEHVASSSNDSPLLRGSTTTALYTHNPYSFFGLSLLTQP